MIAQCIDVLLEEFSASDSDEAEEKTLKKMFQKNCYTIFLVLYLCCVLIEKQVAGKYTEGLIPFDMLCAFKLYLQVKRLYLMMKIRIPSSWRYELEIGHLIAGCFVLIHIFVLFAIFRVLSFS